MDIDLRTVFKIIWIGVCAIAMTHQTHLLSVDRVICAGFGGAPFKTYFYLYIFVGCSAIFGYNFSYSRPIIRNSAWLAGLISVIAYFKLYWITQIVAVVPVLILGFYYGFKMPGTKTGIRSWTWAKPGAIAIAWAWVTVVLPATIYNGHEFLWLFLERIAFISALALAYDLNDLNNDLQKGLQTFPVKYGPVKTILLANLLLLLSAFFIAINWYSSAYSNLVAFGLWSSLWLSFFILRYITRKLLPFYWFKNCVDGLMVLQFLMVYLLVMYFD
jgi:4-hydroxybenzoate polyprenyltransferase